MGIFSSIAGIVGAVGKKKAVGKAADAQIAAAQQGINAIGANNDRTQANFQPYLSTGSSATSAIADLLGLGGTAGQQAAQPQPLTTPNYAAYVQNNPDLAAEYQRDSEGMTPDQWGQRHWEKFGQTENRPYTPTTNPQAVAQPTGDPISGQQAQQSAIDQLKASPLFQSLFRTGEEATLQNASATGGLRGGNVQNSLANFGSDTLAKVIQQQLQNLGSLSGQGLNAATSAGGLSANATNGIAGLFGDQGQARAGGIIGKSNANQQMYNSIADGAGQIAGAFMPVPGAGGAGGAGASGGGGGIMSSLAKLF